VAVAAGRRPAAATATATRPWVQVDSRHASCIKRPRDAKRETETETEDRRPKTAANSQAEISDTGVSSHTPHHTLHYTNSWWLSYASANMGYWAIDNWAVVHHPSSSWTSSGAYSV
jgi:hypothetical protein